MKKFLLVAVVAAGLVGMAMVAGAATNLNNWCTGTYQLTGASVAASGADSAVVARQTAPNILVSKIATNLRTGQSSAYLVNAVQNDTVEFAIIWSNTGEADADNMVLTDYVSAANFTYVTGSLSDTEVDCVGSAAFGSDSVTYTATSVDGTDATASDGIFKFRVIVD